MSTSSAIDGTPLVDGYPADLRLFVAGEWRGPDGRETLAVVNPADGAPIGRLPVADAADVDAALAGAARAWPAWRALAPDARAAVLRRAAGLLRARTEEIATAATLEQGKTRAELRIEVAMAANALEWFAEECRRAYGRALPQRTRRSRITVVREAVGPVAAFTPWNFPLIGPARKLAAALAAGCTCVLKPAEETPASALAIARALADAGLPAGVLSVLFGDPAQISAQLLGSPTIRKLSFTGSAAVGAQLTRLAAEHMQRTTMELGGHAPVIVLDDADLTVAIPHSVGAAFRNAGQICVSPTRFYVQDEVYDAFADGVAAGARSLVVGDGLDEATAMGPLAHERRVAAIDELVRDAVARGARLLAGGGPLDRPGFFYAPTVLGDVPPAARVMNEEPFGPVAVLARVRDVDDAIAQANRLPYGLAAYAFTDSARAVRRIGTEVEAGIVGINTYAIAVPEAPFGGVKASGHGSEDGAEGLDAYLVTKTIHES